MDMSGQFLIANALILGISWAGDWLGANIVLDVLRKILPSRQSNNSRSARLRAPLTLRDT